jgi:hypothetical protein
MPHLSEPAPFLRRPTPALRVLFFFFGIYLANLRLEVAGPNALGKGQDRDT